jgi:hypothetical protein
MGGQMALTDTTVFIFHDGKVYPSLERWSRKRPDSAIARVILKLANHVQFGRTVRSKEYMVDVAHEFFPEFRVGAMLTVGEDGVLPRSAWQGISQVVLLWPDANGMGWGTIERDVLRQVPAGVRIIAVNGRRRTFTLNRRLLAGLRWKRFLEKSLALEIAFTTAFIFITPALMLSDFVRRRLLREAK